MPALLSQRRRKGSTAGARPCCLCRATTRVATQLRAGDPKHLPKGTRIEAVGPFDNSPNNLAPRRHIPVCDATQLNGYAVVFTNLLALLFIRFEVFARREGFFIGLFRFVNGFGRQILPTWPSRFPALF